MELSNKEVLWLKKLEEKTNEELDNERKKLHDEAFTYELLAIINYLFFLNREMIKAHKVFADTIDNLTRENKELVNQISGQQNIIEELNNRINIK
jgi:hypothetical protein